ncbi:MAG: aminoacyl-tRNA hydrolase [Candidatus Krumholzibacteriota bacterium]|nr:aminoacyl-tRNA hydrolase [Candidatus Krumholzibacteriota bacterium]
MSAISLVCGLGNPGDEYRLTRHNLGFMVLDRLAERRRLEWRRAPGPALETAVRMGGRIVRLLKPQTMMNLSGRALASLGGADHRSILVVCDDINLPLGLVRFRLRGGSGGHRGLESIVGALGDENWPRLRLGVGSPPSADRWSDWVLEPFPAEDEPAVDRMIDEAVAGLELAVRRGLDAAMQAHNRRAGEAADGENPA